MYLQKVRALNNFLGFATRESESVSILPLIPANVTRGSKIFAGIESRYDTIHGPDCTYFTIRSAYNWL